MYDKTPYFYGTGRRKSSVARVRLYQGTGKITINDRDIDDYFGLETLKLIVRLTRSLISFVEYQAAALQVRLVQSVTVFQELFFSMIQRISVQHSRRLAS